MKSNYQSLFNPEWKEYFLYDLAIWVNGLTFRDVNFDIGGKFPVVKINELKNGISNKTGFTNQNFDKKYRLQRGDLLFAWSGSPETSIDAFKFDFEQGWLNQHIFKITAKKTTSNEFLFYLLKYLKPELIEIAKNKQTTGLGHITISDLKSFEVRVPDKSIQNQILDKISILDKKIINNSNLQQTIEDIAQSLFESWFVNFDPVNIKIEAIEKGQDPKLTAMIAISGKTEVELSQSSKEILSELESIVELFPDAFEDSEFGLIPCGWDIVSLYETAEYINGSSFKNSDFSPARGGLPIIKIAELKSGIGLQTQYTTNNFLEKYHIYNGDLLYSWSGSPETSLDVFKWFGGEGWLNQHIFKINTKTKEQKIFVYFLLKYLKPQLIEIAKNKQTTGLGHVTIADMKRIKVVMPNKKNLNLLIKKIIPLFDKSSNCTKQNIVLAEQRDLLLPKLLSGAISSYEIGEK